MASFAGLDTQVLGISVDSVPCLTAWAKDLGGINYPLLSDFWPHGAIARAYGVLRNEGTSERALFIIDKKGIIRYVDVHEIDQQPSNEVLRASLRAIDPEVRHRPEPQAPAPVPLPHGGIVMYCTKWCPDCKDARAWLAKHKLPYTEVDITYTAGAAQQVERWANGNRTTPTFDIDGTIVVDFDLPRLREVLHISEG
ncbi:MAG: redoxin domain-containing protein [Anaerolineaceae bacterium]|nr:redoxin domain-containing protein [Anaerolineaceae bacterium]